MDKKTIILSNQQKVDDLIDHLKMVNPISIHQPIYEVTVQVHNQTRSIAQNRMMWMWLKLIADYVNEHSPEQYDEFGNIILYSDEDFHELFKKTYLPTKVIDFSGTVCRVAKSTTKLKTSEFTNYLENIDWYSAKHLGLVLPHPDDLYWAAMGLKQKRTG